MVKDGFIQTFLGKFVLSTPVSSDINIMDIAHSLSLQCRFTGHCKRFYSVAEHSVRVANLVEPSLRKQALLHDATEAYIGDISRPLKKMLPEIKSIERSIQIHISREFGIPVEMHDAVKYADDTLLATEKRDLLGTCPDDVQWETLPKPIWGQIHPWSPEDAEHKFLSFFYSL